MWILTYSTLGEICKSSHSERGFWIKKRWLNLGMCLNHLLSFLHREKSYFTHWKRDDIYWYVMEIGICKDYICQCACLHINMHTLDRCIRIFLGESTSSIGVTFGFSQRNSPLIKIESQVDIRWVSSGTCVIKEFGSG